MFTIAYSISQLWKKQHPWQSREREAGNMNCHPICLKLVLRMVLLGEDVEPLKGGASQKALGSPGPEIQAVAMGLGKHQFWSSLWLPVWRRGLLLPTVALINNGSESFTRAEMIPALHLWTSETELSKPLFSIKRACLGHFVIMTKCWMPPSAKTCSQ